MHWRLFTIYSETTRFTPTRVANGSRVPAFGGVAIDIAAHPHIRAATATRSTGLTAASGIAEYVCSRYWFERNSVPHLTHSDHRRKQQRPHRR